MQFPESWLREFCNPPISTQALADVLTMAGLEVEELRAAAPAFTNVVVGEILEAVQHPNADRLRVCKVGVGAPEALSIVCGAPNARVGIKVPCAMVGAQLPPGADGKAFIIKTGQLRGVMSEGMLCSAKELGLSEEGAGLLELAQSATAGQNLRELLDLDDTVFTLKLTPNLAHCLSVYGIARELSALTGAPLKALPSTELKSSAVLSDQLDVRIQAPDLCGRFSGRVVSGVRCRGAAQSSAETGRTETGSTETGSTDDETNHAHPGAPNEHAAPAKTPDWMVQRLARCGQRSVSPLVDISNYVMFECGQPTHIFDRDKIKGALQVRWAMQGESLKLLNGNTVALTPSVGVIADEQGVESLAGIMGGDASAVGIETTNIYIEAAFWWPTSVAGRSRIFNFSTDAGHRFERGVDPQMTLYALERVSALVEQICGASQTRFAPITDLQVNVPERAQVALRVERATKVIGMPITTTQVEGVMERLGLKVVQCSKTPAGDVLHVLPPSYRFDIQIEEDLIEEVARLIGYDKLPLTPPIAPVMPRVRNEAVRAPFAVLRKIADLGYQETINFSFVKEEWERELAANEDPVRLLNPIAAPMSVMRSSLLGSLLEVLRFNLDRKASSVRVFELGRVFKKDPSVQHSSSAVAGINQPMRVAGLAYGAHVPLQWGSVERLVDFFDIKGDVEALFGPIALEFKPINGDQYPAFHPGKGAEIYKANILVGVLGELHPKHRQAWGFMHAPVLFELDWALLVQGVVPQATCVSRFQSVERDIAVVVKESVTHADVMQAVHQGNTSGLLRGACLFDIYRPKEQSSAAIEQGEKSLAIRLTLSSEAATLTEVQIEQVTSEVLGALSAQLGARLRV